MAIDRRNLPSGAELFAVSGTVVNPTAERQRVPDIRAELRDAHGRLVYSWTITPQQRPLGPRGTHEFNSGKPAVPATSKMLELRSEERRVGKEGVGTCRYRGS